MNTFQVSSAHATRRYRYQKLLIMVDNDVERDDTNVSNNENISGRGNSTETLSLSIEDHDVTSTTTPIDPISPRNANNISWSPSGVWWKDFIYFAGPGWFVSIAYVDPGNYQADIQAGAISRYSLLCILWWTSLLSIYVQVLCVRLAHYGGITLAEAQAKYSTSNILRFINWAIAEFSIIITDLPEVIGFGIACNVFFQWPYWVGVVLSLFTTMFFLLTLNYSTRILEVIVAVFVGIMAVALLSEMSFVGPNTKELLEGWAYGIKDVERSHIFAITGVVGAVVMPHNLYLHTAACQSRTVPREHVEKAVYWSSIEPVFPVIATFFINLAVVTISAERVYGSDSSDDVGLTNFCQYFESLAAGCTLWGIALMAAGQSSAITTTYTGQYVMDGFLNLQLPIRMRAILTRLIAILPCVIVSVLLPNQLNQMVNVVNALLSFLLPFAFTPLVKFNCSEIIMGQYTSKGFEKKALYVFAFSVWLINAVGLSIQDGGFFGNLRATRQSSGEGVTFTGTIILLLEIFIQIFYAWWNWKFMMLDISNETEGTMVNNALTMVPVSQIDEEDNNGEKTSIDFEYS